MHRTTVFLSDITFIIYSFPCWDKLLVYWNKKTECLQLLKNKTFNYLELFNTQENNESRQPYRFKNEEIKSTRIIENNSENSLQRGTTTQKFRQKWLYFFKWDHVQVNMYLNKNNSNGCLSKKVSGSELSKGSDSTSETFG